MLALATETEAVHRRNLRHPLAGFAALAVVLVVGGGASWLATAPASAYGVPEPVGVATPDGSFWLPFSQGLLGVNPVAPNTLLYGDLVYVEFLNSEGNRTVELTSNQSGSGPAIWLNLTESVGSHAITVFQFTLPVSLTVRTTVMCIDGGCMTFTHQSPQTLIPSGILTIGGLDLLAFGMTVEFAVLVVPTILLARYLTRKALWSPKVRLWVVAPHVVTFWVFFILFDYQVFDEVFSGLGFIFIPVVFDIMLFFWALHLFNVAVPVEVLRPSPTGGHGVQYHRARIFVGELPDGRKVLVGAKWRDWVARLAGHAPVLVDPSGRTGRTVEPAESRLVTTRTETRDERVRRLKAPRADPFGQFPVVQASGKALAPKEREPPRLLYWVSSDQWLSTDMPYLSFHRLVRTPEVRDGTTGVVTKPSELKRVLAWPHYVDPPAVTSLADVHYHDAISTWLGLQTDEKLSRRLEMRAQQNHVLRTTPLVLADEYTELSIDEVFEMLHRSRFPITDEEANEETRAESPKPSVKDAAPSETEDVGTGGPPTRGGRSPTGGR